MKSKFYIVVIAAMCLLQSCQPVSLDCPQYLTWIEDESNELRVTKELDGFSFALQYKPIPYIILMENGGKCPESTAYWKRAAELDELQYYTLRISSDQDIDLLKAGARSDEEYYSRLEYFTSVMQNDIALVSGDDTLACVLYHYERNYNLSPHSNFLLGFEKPLKPEGRNSRTLIFHDQIFGVGTVKLSIAEENIKSAPALNEAL